MKSAAFFVATTLSITLLPTYVLADMTGDCETHGVAFSKKQGGTITRIQIERVQFPIADRYDDKVGSQFVSTELKGMARVTSADGTKLKHYICLHDGKRAVYLGLID